MMRFLAISLVLLALQGESIAWALPDASQLHQLAKEKTGKGKQSKNKKVEDTGPMRICLVASVYVPHNNNALDNFIAYPYPLTPLQVTAFKTNLPTDSDKITELLKNELTANKWLIDDAFLRQGFFMQDAFKNALNDCNLPKTGKFDPAWLEQVTTAFKLQAILSNKRELERKDRYDNLVKYVSEDEEGLKDKADAAKLSPVRIPVSQLRHNLWQGCEWLGEGTWWVVGTHRLPKLTYYWQVKINVPEDATLKTGDAQYLQLTEQNATAIDEE